MTDLKNTPLFFGSFCLSPQRRTLERNGQPLALTPKEFDTLLTLAEAGGQVVSKQELLRRVWPDSYVGDGSLARNISVLRKTLGADVIETAARHGYRLGIPVTAGSDVVPKPAAEMQSEAVAAPDVPPVEGKQWPAERVLPIPAALAPRPRVNQIRWLAYAAALMLVVGIAALLNRTSVSQAKVKTAPSHVRIAVLPFANYSGNPANDYLCDGMTEAMISELSRLSPGQLGVIARTSSMKYKKTDLAIPQIARELEADYILESSVRSSNDRVRVTTQLVRGGDASHVWTGEYERSLRDALDIQQQVSIAVAEEIRLKIDPAWPPGGMARTRLMLRHTGTTCSVATTGTHAIRKDCSSRWITSSGRSRAIRSTRGLTRGWPTLTWCLAAAT